MSDVNDWGEGLDEWCRDGDSWHTWRLLERFPNSYVFYCPSCLLVLPVPLDRVRRTTLGRVGLTLAPPADGR